MNVITLIILLFLCINICYGKKKSGSGKHHREFKFISAKENIYTNYTNDVVFNNVAGELNNKVKVFCIFLTTPKNKQSRIRHQKNTWVKRCNAYIYASGSDDEDIPAIKAFRDDHYRYSYAKIDHAFRYVYKHYIDKYDWFLKIDCDTYVVMENLRMLLLKKDPNEHYYSGFHHNLNVNKPPFKLKNLRYAQGGGYVMSKKTLSLLVTKGLGNKKYCRIEDDGFEDVEIGICLYNLNVKLDVGRDKYDRIAYLNIGLDKALSPYNNYLKNYYSSIKSKFRFIDGIGAMSEYPISFHRVYGETMYILEYLIYHMHVAGLRNPMFIPSNENVTETTQSIMEIISSYSSSYYKN
uniref:N-acetylgalactosaminide beta-1,3-galactosyltransferase n=1 Tax=Strongyloides papillosus TaxID=174720 RepID=A0A0N5CAI5_STREA